MTDYPTVTLDEARATLPDLLERVAAGERFVITHAGRWVAKLSAPPSPPPTPDEIAERQARATAAIKNMVLQGIRDGYPLPPDSKLRELFAEGELPA